jgi:DnaJ-class molecular chaperone
MEKEEAYEILGLGADQTESVKKAYLRLSKENHPDVGGDPAAFLKIHEAYKLLTEVQPPPESRVDSMQVSIQISLEEAIFGVVLETHLTQQISSSSPLIGSCSAKIVTVIDRIPPMVALEGGFESIHKECVIGGSARDLKMIYVVREHQRYKPSPDRSKGLISVEETIPVMTAVHGGVIEIETLFGRRKMYVKPGTKMGDSYEIKYHGHLGSLIVIVAGLEMPVMQNSSFIIPDEVEEEEKQLRENREAVAKIIDQNQAKTIIRR